MSKASLYINSKGYPVTRHSYSGSDSFHFCARKYQLERVQGWSEKVERSSKFFGTAVEAAVQWWHQHKETGGVEKFIELWAEHKDKPYTYTKTDLDWNRLNLSGQEIVRLYTIRYPTFPYVVVNPETAFQVQTNFEVFPGSKLAGIEFTSYIDIVAQMKGTFEPVIIDEKTSGKDVPEFTVLDPQLRSYSWVKTVTSGREWPNVAFVWYRKMGRTIAKGDTVTLLEPWGGFAAGDDVTILSKDGLGGWFVTPNQRVVDEIDGLFKGESKAVVAARTAHVEANGVLVPERVITKQKVQYKQVVISQESRDDIGKSIKRDIINIASATENDFFPMESGVRFPNEKCPMCAMRGICSGNAELRDLLLERKQLDELAFQADNE